MSSKASSPYTSEPSSTKTPKTATGGLASKSSSPKNAPGSLAGSTRVNTMTPTSPNPPTPTTTATAPAFAAPTITVPPSVLPAAAPPAASSTTDANEPNGGTRGWQPEQDGRFRVSLTHHFVEDTDEQDDSRGGAGSGNFSRPSAFANVVPEDLSPDAAAALCEEACHTPTNDALCNQCDPAEPRIEVSVEASLVNAINSAYTSTGYPFVVTAGNARGAVYGSFVDISNPTLSSLELPPEHSFIVAPSYNNGRADGGVGGAAGTAATLSGVTEMDTLLAIQWSRGDRIMTTAGTAAAAAVAASQGKAAASSSSVKEGKGVGSSGSGGAGSAPPPTSAGPAGTPHSPAVARTIAHHLTQYPEGIHGIHSSMDLRRIVVEGKLPTVHAFAPSAPLQSLFAAPLAAAGGNVGVRTEGGTAEEGGTSTAAAAAPATAAAAATGSPTGQQPPSNAEANIPPLPQPPQSNAPVQHTLVSASTFNHVSVYVVAHQDGQLLYTAPIQSLSASIATRKVTAHQLIAVGREEVEARVSDPLKAVTSKPSRRTRIAFADVPVTGDETAVFFQSKTTHFVGADASRRTVAAAPIRFTVEPHLLFGNQNGDIFVFSLLQERIVQHMNYNAGSQQVSPSIASGNSGVGSKLICSPVSCIAEVQNGIEKKLTGMIEYAAVAKRNRRPYFESDDIPTAFTPDKATQPTHYYYPVPPSLYAVGFDNGQMLLLCITCEGGWMLRHFNSQFFGLRPIHSIAIRVPPFYTRVWTSSLPPITTTDAAAAAKEKKTTPTPVRSLITPEHALIVHEEEQHIAAVACNGGVIALVRLPGMEIISSVAPTDYNAVGEILALQWIATAPRHLLTPDVLIASGEDDTMTAFQLLAHFLFSTAESSSHHHHNSNAILETTSHLSSNESVLANGRLRILEKKKFHRSWVSRLGNFPIVLPAAASTAAAALSKPLAASGGGMPQYLGTCLVATAYDHRTSFWPYTFTSGNSGGGADGAGDDGGGSGNRGSHDYVGGGGADGHMDSVSGNGAGGFLAASGGPLSFNAAASPDNYVLVDGPTAAYPLHTELVISVAAAGGGTSFFLVTVCCRGKVKFWSMKVCV